MITSKDIEVVEIDPTHRGDRQFVARVKNTATATLSGFDNYHDPAQAAAGIVKMVTQSILLDIYGESAQKLAEAIGILRRNYQPVSMFGNIQDNPGIKELYEVLSMLSPQADDQKIAGRIVTPLVHFSAGFEAGARGEMSMQQAGHAYMKEFYDGRKKK